MRKKVHRRLESRFQPTVRQGRIGEQSIFLLLIMDSEVQYASYG
jgi:hypothetical protein